MALYTWSSSFSSLANTTINADDIVTSSQITAFQAVIDAYCPSNNSSDTSTNANTNYYCSSNTGCGSDCGGHTSSCACNTSVYCYPATCSSDT